MTDLDLQEQIDPLAIMGIKKAKAVFTALHAAGFKTEYGWNEDAAEQVWGAAINEFPMELLMKITEDWVTKAQDREFPTLPEFRGAVNAMQKAVVSSQKAASREAGQICQECFDGLDGERTHGWVDVTSIEARKMNPFALETRPCSQCRPVQYDLWRQKHFDVQKEGDPHRCRSEHCNVKHRKAK